MDGHGQFYLTGGTGRIQKVSTTGQELAIWGSSGPWDISLLRPVGLAVQEDGTIYIVDRAAGRLLKVHQLLPVLH